MNSETLKKSIFNIAIQGKLVSQNPEEGTTLDLLMKMDINIEKLKMNSIDYPYELPHSWEWIKLEDISEYIKAGGDKPKVFSDEKTNKHLYPVIANGEKNDGIVGYTDEPKINEHCITVSGRGTIGYTSVRDYPFTPIVRLLVIRLKEPINLKYAQIALSTLLESGVGTSIKQLTVPMIKLKWIPLPPLNEQKRIVDKIEKLLPKIENYDNLYSEITKINKNFPEDLKKSILQFATRGKLSKQNLNSSTGHDLYKNSMKKKDELIENGSIKRQKNIKNIDPNNFPFDIPDTWKWVRLSDIALLKMGKTPPRSESQYWSLDIPWISIADMVSDNFTKNTREKISNFALETKFNNILSPKGTLIMSFKLTIGKVSILDIDAVHNEAIVSIFPFIDYENILRNYLFKTLPLLVDYANTKVAIKGKTLNSTSLNNLMIPLPSLEEQKMIVNEISTFEKFIDTLKTL